MDELQKIQTRQAELRKELAALLADPDGDTDRMEACTKELASLDVRLRAVEAVQTKEGAEGADPEKRFADMPSVGSGDGEEKEFDDLYHRTRLTRYLHNIYSGKEGDGAEKEFSEAVFGDAEMRNNKAQSIPMHMFLPFDEELEVRVDSATTVTAANGMRVTRPILSRVFARTDSEYIGARFIPVAAGQQAFPYISGGASLGYADEGTDVDADAGTITVETSDPIEAGLAYLVGMTTMKRFASGELEAALREDARAAITSGLDDTVLKGRAAASITGLSTDITGLEGALANDANATDVITAIAFLQEYASRVDGTYANEWTDVRMLVRSEVYQKVLFLNIGTNGDRLTADLMAPGRMRATQRLTAPSSNRSQAISYSPLQDRGELVVPVWEDVGVIVDPYTKASARQVRFTFNLAHNVLMLRNNPWKKHSIKTA